MKLYKNQIYDSPLTFRGAERKNIYCIDTKNSDLAKICAKKDIAEERRKIQEKQKSEIIKPHPRKKSYSIRVRNCNSYSKVEIDLLYQHLEIKDAELQGYRLV